MKPKIPASLYRPLPNRQDRLNVVEDLRLLLLWREVCGSEPYDHVRAVALQRRLWTQSHVQQLEQAKRRSIEQTKGEKQAVDLHRAIVELVFGIEVLGNPDEINAGEIGWNTQIKDKITGKTIGTPRTLLNQTVTFEWRCDTDCRTNLELYLEQVKRKYHDYTYAFHFQRVNLPLGSRWSRYLTFEIRLFWRSIGMSLRTRRKLNLLISKSRK